VAPGRLPEAAGSHAAGRRRSEGVDVQRGAADLTGRVGDAITFRFVNEAVVQTTMIVDPRTGALLSKSNALVDPRGRSWLKDLPIGEDSTSVYLASGSVTFIRQTP
jgi:hypothetical protein